MLETASVDVQGPYTVIPGPPAGWIPPIGASTNTWANIYENKQRIDYCTDQFAYLTNRFVTTLHPPMMPPPNPILDFPLLLDAAHLCACTPHRACAQHAGETGIPRCPVPLQPSYKAKHFSCSGGGGRMECLPTTI